MTRFISLLIALPALLIALPANAEEFFKSSKDGWTVSGRANVQSLNDICAIEQNWNHKTFFSLYQDMDDGELYAVITNPAWNITNPPGSTHTLSIDFTKQKGLTATFEVMNNNSIRIRHIKTEQFMQLFVTNESMFIKMPGNIPGLTISLKGTRNAFNSIVECMGKYESIKAHPRSKDSTQL